MKPDYIFTDVNGEKRPCANTSEASLPMETAIKLGIAPLGEVTVNVPGHLILHGDEEFGPRDVSVDMDGDFCIVDGVGRNIYLSPTQARTMAMYIEALVAAGMLRV